MVASLLPSSLNGCQIDPSPFLNELQRPRRDFPGKNFSGFYINDDSFTAIFRVKVRGVVIVVVDAAAASQQVRHLSNHRQIWLASKICRGNFGVQANFAVYNASFGIANDS